MSYETILYAKEKGLGIIILNRPEQGNSINEQLIKDMNAIFDEVEKDKEVRVVVITGGEKLFCSGADLKEPRQPGRSQRANRLFSRVEKFNKPTLAPEVNAS